jgi:glyoxylase-like metal-dependent hydrolase (beta-lactamase superfamily II)
MNEICPGIYHWTARHPAIRMRVSSYYVEPAGLVLDPLEPEDGWGFFDGLDTPPQQVVLTINLHWRHSDRFRDRYGATIRGSAQGLHRFEGTGREVEPFDFGEEIAPGVTALEMGAIAPDDTVLHIAHGDGALAFADAVIAPEGVLGFVPDGLMEDPAGTKQAIHAKLRGLLERDFETLLFAHGRPIVGGGHAALRDFVEKPVGEADFGHMA